MQLYQKYKSDSLFRGQVKILVTTWLAYAGFYFCRKAFFVVKSDLAGALSLSVLDLAHLGTGYFAAYMFGQFASAMLGPLLGARLLLLVGMLLSIVCNIVFGFANSFWLVLLFLIINGFAQGTGWPSCIGSLAFWFKREQRGKILGLWSTCYQLGPVLAGFFIAYLWGAYGWRWSFLGVSLVFLSIWFIVLFYYPQKGGLSEDDSEVVSLNEKVKMKNNITFIVITMGLVYFCLKFIRYAFISWLPFFLIENYKLAGDKAGYLSTIFDGFGFAGVILAGYLSDKIFKGKRAMVSLIMIILMFIGFIYIYQSPTGDLLLFTIFLASTGFMLYGPDSLISGTGAIDATSQKSALKAAGIINGIGSIGALVQEHSIAWLYEAHHGELKPILLLMGCMAFAGVLLSSGLFILSKKGYTKL